MIDLVKCVAQIKLQLPNEGSFMPSVSIEHCDAKVQNPFLQSLLEASKEQKSPFPYIPQKRPIMGCRF